MAKQPTITVTVKGSAKHARRAAARRGISLTACKDAASLYNERAVTRVACQAPCRDEQKLYDWQNRAKLDTPIKGRHRKVPGDIVGIIANRCRR